MKPGLLAKDRKLQVLGRSISEDDITLFWTASGVRFITDATEVWAELEAVYDRLDLWIEVVVDGEVSQRRPLENGTNRICLWRGGELRRPREFKILRTTQSFTDDDVSIMKITDIDSNGSFFEVKEKSLLLEFVGDSITSGEGGALTREEDWLPAVFSCTDNYAYFTASELNADYNCVSQSGWGLYAAWDADYTHVIPPHYEKVAGTLPGARNAIAGAQNDWNFEKRTADAVIINLGTNDQSALASYKTIEEKEKFRKGFEETAVNFLKTVRKNNPKAYILWSYGMMGLDIAEDIETAIAKYSAETGDRRVSFKPLPHCRGDEIGMRVHPTHKGHALVASILSAELKDKLGLTVSGIMDVMGRAENGEKLNIGYIGGSYADSEPSRIAKSAFDWWVKEFPKARFTYVDAAVGGTDSYYAVGKVEDNLLAEAPDLVMVDFSDNDKANSFYQETYEGLIRKILGAKNHPAMMAIFGGAAAIVGGGTTAEDFQKKVCDHYCIESISADASDAGDIGKKVIDFLAKVKAMLAKDADHGVEGYGPGAATLNRDVVRELPAPLTYNRFENTKRAVFNKEFASAGEVFTFDVTCTRFGVQYRKNADSPALMARLIIDKDMLHPIILDGNLDSDSAGADGAGSDGAGSDAADQICLDHIFTYMAEEDHHFELEIIEKDDDSDEKPAPFLLYSFYYS